MNDLSGAFLDALRLILTGDRDLLEIVVLSLQVSLSAVVIACLVGLPLGAALAVFRFPGRGAVTVLVNALMGLPPVVVGLFVYMMLSNSGPLGVLKLLYTPTAMIIAQAILVAPIIIALSRQVIDELQTEYDEQLRSMGMSRTAIAGTLLFDARYSLVTVALAGFGRAIAEVGAVLIVGGNINHVTRVMTTTIALETSKGNINHVTRVMTTTIALETSKGNIALALGLGTVLILVALIVNGLVMSLRRTAVRMAYA